MMERKLFSYFVVEIYDLLVDCHHRARAVDVDNIVVFFLYHDIQQDALGNDDLSVAYFENVDPIYFLAHAVQSLKKVSHLHAAIE